MKQTLTLTLGLVVLGCISAVVAQVPNEQLAIKITTARRQNAALMKQYTWNCRTEVMDKDKVADIRLELINYGPDGNLQRTVINDQKASLPGGFLRHAIAENQRKEVEKYLKGLHDLIDQYTLPTAGKILDFISQASITGTQGPDGTALLQMTGNSIIVPGDTFTLAVDPVTQQSRRVTISTSFEGSLVSISATFKTNKAGLTYMSFAQIDVPDKQISLKIQNFDYELSN